MASYEDARIIEEQFTINDAHIRQVVTKDYQIDWPLHCVFGWYEEFLVHMNAHAPVINSKTR